VNIIWREVSDLILLRQMLPNELERIQSILGKLVRQQNQNVAPDVAVIDRIDIFSIERDRICTKLGEVDDRLRQVQDEVSDDLIRHNRLIELWRRSIILGERT